MAKEIDMTDYMTDFENDKHALLDFENDKASMQRVMRFCFRVMRKNRNELKAQCDEQIDKLQAQCDEQMNRMKEDLNYAHKYQREFREDINKKVALLKQDLLASNNTMNEDLLKIYNTMNEDLDKRDVKLYNVMNRMKNSTNEDANDWYVRMKRFITEKLEKREKQIRDTQKQISALAQLYAIQIASSQYNQPVNEYNDLLLSRLNLMNFTTTEVAQVVSTYQGTYDVSGKYVPPAPLYWVVDNGNLILNEIPACVVCLNSMRDTLILPCNHLACCQTCFPKLNDCPICRGAMKEHKVLDWVEELTNVPSGNVTPYYMSGIFKDTRTQFERLCI